MSLRALAPAQEVGRQHQGHYHQIFQTRHAQQKKLPEISAKRHEKRGGHITVSFLLKANDDKPGGIHVPTQEKII